MGMGKIIKAFMNMQLLMSNELMKFKSPKKKNHLTNFSLNLSSVYRVG